MKNIALALVVLAPVFAHAEKLPTKSALATELKEEQNPEYKDAVVALTKKFGAPKSAETEGQSWYYDSRAIPGTNAYECQILMVVRTPAGATAWTQNGMSSDNCKKSKLKLAQVDAAPLLARRAVARAA